MFRKQKSLFAVSIAKEALESIFDECDQFDSHETGGRLIGCYEQKEGKYSIRLLGVIGPGPNAERSATSFFQDGEYQEKIFRSIEERLPEIEHLGNWHTHHVNGLPSLSSGDKATYQRIVNHDKHNTDFFYALLIVRKTPGRSQRYQVKHYFFRRNTDAIYEVADEDVRVMEIPAVWSKRRESIRAFPSAEPHVEARHDVNPERVKDQEFFTDFCPNLKPLFSARAGAFYWKGQLEIINGTTIDLVAMEATDEGACRYRITASSPAIGIAELLKTYPKDTFRSARHAVNHLKDWLNRALYESKKPEEATR